MTWRRWTLVAALGAVVLLPVTHAADGVTVSLCDGQSQMVLPDVQAGVELPRAQAERVAGEMMQAWRRSQGEERWTAWARESGAVRLAGAAQVAPPPPAAAPDQPTKFTARDRMLWKREEQKTIDEGYKAYHNAKALGGTIGISCDMCHPNGANTHAETYPKYQSQLKKVALLRDMINWCIENPLKGKPLAESDPTLRAVEAYILSTRKGVALEAGKH